MKKEIKIEDVSRFVEIVSSFSPDILKAGMQEIENGKILLPWRKGKDSVSRDALTFKRAISISNFQSWSN